VQRPTVYRIIAVVILLYCLSEVASAGNAILFARIKGHALPWWLYFGFAPPLTGVIAAAALWLDRRWTSQAYAVWAVLATLGLTLNVVKTATNLVAVHNAVTTQAFPNDPFTHPMWIVMAVVGSLTWALALVGAIGLGYLYLSVGSGGSGPSATAQLPD
jgi:hypothetical protein